MTPDLHSAAPDLQGSVAARAAIAYTCAALWPSRPSHFLVADMSKPSSTDRLYVFDMSDPKHPILIGKTRVAHGAGSDPDKTGLPESFGNVMESGKTSLGLYEVAESYVGKHGKSYALNGLDPDWNSRARERRVVLHPAGYVRETGTIGRSLGCPAVNPKIFNQLDKVGALTHSLFWIDGPNTSLASAPSLSCPMATWGAKVGG